MHHIAAVAFPRSCTSSVAECNRCLHLMQDLVTGLHVLGQGGYGTVIKVLSPSMMTITVEEDCISEKCCTQPWATKFAKVRASLHADVPAWTYMMNGCD